MNDLIILWPQCVDYPLFRKKIPFFKKYFNKIIICLTLAPTLPDLTSELKRLIPDVIFVEQEDYSGDWVTNAMHLAIKESDSPYICVMHQDLFIKDWDKFFSKINIDSDLLGFNHSEVPKIQPVFWRIKRSTYEKTNKDFSTDTKRGMDSFTKLSEDVRNLGLKITTLKDLDIISPRDFYHLQGATEGFVWGLDPTYSFHHPEAFYLYSLANIRCDIEQIPTVKLRFEQIAERLEKYFSDIFI